jgi:hypothetical protein
MSADLLAAALKGIRTFDADPFSRGGMLRVGEIEWCELAPLAVQRQIDSLNEHQPRRVIAAPRATTTQGR